MKFSFKKESEKQLSDDEIAKALASYNEELIENLFGVVRSLFELETNRTSSLDTKAANLYGPLGILGSVIFLAIGFINEQKHDVLSKALSSNAGACYLGLMGVITIVIIIFLFRAVQVTDKFRAPGEKDIISRVPELDGFEPGAPLGENQKRSAHDYRRHLSEHFWKLYRVSRDVNENKASSLRWAHTFLFLAAFLIVLGAIVIIYEHGRGNFMAEQNKQTPAAASQVQSTQEVISRPPPLQTSSQGVPTSDGASSRPPALEASSSGQRVRFSEERPKPLTPSTGGKPITNDTGSSGK